MKTTKTHHRIAASLLAAMLALGAWAAPAAAQTDQAPPGCTALTPANLAACTGPWAPLIMCESGGNPAALNPADTNGRASLGLVQFQQATWDGVARNAGWAHLVGLDPRTQPASVQLEMAEQLRSTDGLRPWPHCGQFYGGCFRNVCAGGTRPAPEPQPAAPAPAAPTPAPAGPDWQPDPTFQVTQVPAVPPAGVAWQPPTPGEQPWTALPRGPF